MPHYRLTITSPTGEYPFYIEARDEKQAEGRFLAILDETEKGRYTVASITEREPRFGYVLIMGGNGTYGKFGSGPDLTEAKKVFRSHGGVLGLGYTILEFPEKTDFLGVDEMGRYSWNGDGPKETVVAPR